MCVDREAGDARMGLRAGENDRARASEHTLERGRHGRAGMGQATLREKAAGA